MALKTEIHMTIVLILDQLLSDFRLIYPENYFLLIKQNTKYVHVFINKIPIFNLI